MPPDKFPIPTLFAFLIPELLPLRVTCSTSTTSQPRRVPLHREWHVLILGEPDDEASRKSQEALGGRVWG